MEIETKRASPHEASLGAFLRGREIPRRVWVTGAAKRAARKVRRDRKNAKPIPEPAFRPKPKRLSGSAKRKLRKNRPHGYSVDVRQLASEAPHFMRLRRAHPHLARPDLLLKTWAWIRLPF